MNVLPEGVSMGVMSMGDYIKCYGHVNFTVDYRQDVDLMRLEKDMKYIAFSQMTWPMLRTVQHQHGGKLPDEMPETNLEATLDGVVYKLSYKGSSLADSHKVWSFQFTSAPQKHATSS